MPFLLIFKLDCYLRQGGVCFCRRLSLCLFVCRHKHLAHLSNIWQHTDTQNCDLSQLIVKHTLHITISSEQKKKGVLYFSQSAVSTHWMLNNWHNLQSPLHSGPINTGLTTSRAQLHDLAPMCETVPYRSNRLSLSLSIKSIGKQRDLRVTNRESMRADDAHLWCSTPVTALYFVCSSVGNLFKRGTNIHL